MGLLFVLIHHLSKKVNKTIVILLALFFGAAVGFVFASENNTYLVLVELIGNIYVNVITALAAPIILISIISSFVSLKNKEAVRSIGVRSVFWLLLSAAGAIVLSLLAGTVFQLWDASAIFKDITAVSGSTVSAYGGLKKSFDEVLLALFPSNFVGDIANNNNNNIVAVIIIAAAMALVYIDIASKEGEDNIVSFKKLVEAIEDDFQNTEIYHRYDALCGALLVCGKRGQHFLGYRHYSAAASVGGHHLRGVVLPRLCVQRIFNKIRGKAEPCRVFQEDIPGAGNRVYHSKQYRNAACFH